MLSLIAACSLTAAAYPRLSTSKSAAGNFCGTGAGCIYPMPQHATQGAPSSGGTPPTLDPQRFHVKCQPIDHPACTSTILPAVERIKARIFPVQNGTQTSAGSLVSELVVKLGSTESVPLQHGINETYELTVPSASSSMSIAISAASEWGALHGLESFAQSVALLQGTSHNFFPTPQPFYCLMLWPPARIVDSPRTAWRGLM